MTVSLRNTQEHKGYTFERLYGILKTYELEMEQDEEIEKNQRKGGSAALMASSQEVHDDEDCEAAITTPNPRVCEGKNEASKGKGKTAEDESGTDDEVDEHLAFLSRKFSKLKFKRSQGPSKPFKKEYQPNKNMVDKSKFRCYNCGVAGHFLNECRKPKVERK